MKQLADGVWHLGGFPPNAINVFLIEDVVIDAATRYDGRRILKQLRGHPVAAHALTHAHSDHQGASHRVCTELSVPFWVGEHDADAAENPELMGERMPSHPITRLVFKTCAGPAHPVDRNLREGDEVAGSRYSTCPATPPATSPSGASRTAWSSPAMCSTPPTRCS